MSIVLKKKDESYLTITIGDIYEFTERAFKYIQNEEIISYNHVHFHKYEPKITRHYIENIEPKAKKVFIIYKKINQSNILGIHKRMNVIYILVCIDSKSISISLNNEIKKIKYNGSFFAERIAQVLIIMAIYDARYHEINSILNIIMQEYIISKELLLVSMDDQNIEQRIEQDYFFECVFCNENLLNNTSNYSIKNNRYLCYRINNSINDKTCIVYRIRLYRCI